MWSLITVIAVEWMAQCVEKDSIRFHNYRIASFWKFRFCYFINKLHNYCELTIVRIMDDSFPLALIFQEIIGDGGIWSVKYIQNINFN